MNPLNLRGKVIIVTGGEGFLGSQFVPYLRELGATVVIFDAKSAQPVDITDPASVKAAVEGVAVAHGAIHGLVHAAGIAAEYGKSDDMFVPYEEFSLDLWNQEFLVNVTAAHIVTQTVASHMMKQKSGSIVFVASDLALIAPDNSLYEPGKFKDVAYVSSKASIMGLMRAWASYLGPHNVRANALVPGGMIKDALSEAFTRKNGSLNMLGRMSEPGEYNAALAFLLSDASSYMTAAPLIIDGGRTAKTGSSW